MWLDIPGLGWSILRMFGFTIRLGVRLFDWSAWMCIVSPGPGIDVQGTAGRENLRDCRVTEARRNADRVAGVSCGD